MSETDLELIARYARHHSEDAFTELVRRHLALVYSTALRQTGSPQLAEEAAQGTFLSLARDAGKLAPDTILAAWLYRVSHRTATNLLRGEIRRRWREQAATEMNAMNASAADWEQIEPLLDEAMHALDETDRAAVLLRYFENKSLRDVGQALGASENAAQKRLARAIERLRDFFAHRGVTVGTSALGVALSSHAVHAAPAGLAASIGVAASVATTAFVSTSATVQSIAMTTLQKSLIAAALVAAVGTALHQSRQATQLRDQIQALQESQAAAADQYSALQAANAALSNKIARSDAASQAQFAELMRLRGGAGLARADAAEVARLKSALADQAARTEPMTNAMAIGLELAVKARMSMAQTRLDLMKQTLNLSDEQAKAIREILQAHTHKQTEMAMSAMQGRMSPELGRSIAADGRQQEEEILSALTPEQRAAYPQFQQAEKAASAERAAQYQAKQVADEFDLPDERRDQLKSALYQLNLAQPARGAAGQPGEAITRNLESERAQLDARLTVLEGFLTPAQLASYREQQLRNINAMAGMLKVFQSNGAAGAAPSAH